MEDVGVNGAQGGGVDFVNQLQQGGRNEVRAVRGVRGGIH